LDPLFCKTVRTTHRPSTGMAKVTVLLSVYNGEKYLRHAVESILSQTFADFEFIILDDGSTDGTWNMLSGYSDRRIKLVRNEVNIGLTKSLNRGLALACGEYIARMDADDVSLPTRLAIQTQFLDANPDVGVLASNIENINSQGDVTLTRKLDCHPDLVKWYELFYNHVAGHSRVMFRASLTREVGGYDDTLTTAQDYDLWSRMAQRTHLVILPDVLHQARIHEGNMSFARFEHQQLNAHVIAYRNLDDLMGPGWAHQAPGLELIGFWSTRFSNCPAPVRLWRNMAQLRATFLRRSDLMSSKEDCRAMIQGAMARQLGRLSRYWLRQRHFARATITAMLAILTSPSEISRLLTRKVLGTA